MGKTSRQDGNVTINDFESEAFKAEIMNKFPELNPTNKLKSLDSVADGEVIWLWEPYIQGNNLTVLRGDGGTGKSMFACGLMAAISKEFRPLDMPGDVHGHGNSIYFGLEDDDFIIKNRVKAAGGDLNKIFIYTDQIQLSDTELLTALIRSASAKMVIFDPLQSFLGSGVDMNRANEIRPIMDGLREVARNESCAILIIEHMNKATAQKALYRGIGSIDVVSASRSVLMCGYDPIREDSRVIMQIKSNSKRGKPISFKIDSDGCFYWQGTSTVTEEELAVAPGVFSSATPKDTLVEGIKALIEAHPAGWTGTAAEMFVQISQITGTTILTPEGIGKRINSTTVPLQLLGILWNKRKTNRGTIYEIYKK